MSTIIMYFRSLFCKHAWELIGDVQLLDEYSDVPVGYTKTYRCTKCGYVQRVKL